MITFSKGVLLTPLQDNKEIYLDKLNNFRLFTNDPKLANEVRKLLEYRAGIYYVYKKVKDHDEHYNKFFHENYINNGISHVFLPGGGQGYEENFTSPLKGLLPYLHDIFATSLINYLRLTGFCYCFNNGEITEDMFDDNDKEVKIEKRRKIKNKCSDYLKGIPEIADLKEYRNKVAGHFAITDPNLKKLENLNTLFGSSNVTFSWDKNKKKFFMISKSYFPEGKKVEGSENKLPTFILTELFEKIKDRFYLDKEV